MKALIVLTIDAPGPEDAARALAAVDPPSIPHFAGEARLAIEPYASAVLDYLDGGDMDTQDALAGIYHANREAPNPVTRDLVRSVHAAYVELDRPATPSDRDDLLTLLRALYVALPATTKEPTP